MTSRRIAFIAAMSGLFLASCASQGWKQVVPQTSPPPSGQGVAAFIDSSESAILFGGITHDKWSNDTWIWDGKTWHQVFPATSPSPREKAAIAYDRSRNRVVLFGGVMNNSLYNDTWEWNGQIWQLMNPAHRPPARCCHAMAYDSVNRNVLLYGGYDPTNKTFFSDTWNWDGTDWTEISRSAAPQMSGHVMVTFPAGGEIISVQTSGLGTWSWDGTIWSDLGIDSPPARTEGRIAYDSKNSRAVFFGGLADSRFLDDTWVFDGSRWLQLSLPKGPPGRYGHVMFYDPIRGSVILFGGIGPNNTFLADTWELRLPAKLSNLVETATPAPTP